MIWWWWQLCNATNFKEVYTMTGTKSNLTYWAQIDVEFFVKYGVLNLS